MKTLKITFVLALALLFWSFTPAGASVSFSLGTDNFYVSVGDYDYLPYAYETVPGFAPARISFYSVLGDYGEWVPVGPFGQCWRPYASFGWRPYVYGHWIYTQYGPMWEGYEPWAWIGYHYGSWIFTANLGWVWVPGYEWHPGRVAWAHSYDTIGWMPLPPDGYDYHNGALAYAGPNSQFSYRDDDFAAEVDTGSFSYGGPYYDPRYRPLYYNPAYMNINVNFWVFIDNNNFTADNYADVSLGPDYTRYVFDRKLIRVTNQGIDRPVLEKMIRQPVQEVPVDVKSLDTDKQRIRVVVPKSETEIEKVRKHGSEVVKEVIAPSFAEKQKPFKGTGSKNRDVVTKIFHQENVSPRTETLTSDQVVNRGIEVKKYHEQQRTQRVEAAKTKVDTVEKEGRIREPKKENPTTKPPSDTMNQHELQNLPQEDPNNPGLSDQGNHPQPPGQAKQNQNKNKSKNKNQKEKNNPQTNPQTHPSDGTDSETNKGGF